MERLRQLEDEGNVVVNSGQQVDKIAVSWLLKRTIHFTKDCVNSLIGILC